MVTKKTTKVISIEGMSKGDAMEAMIKGGMSFNDAETYWAQNGSKRAGFRAKYYEECLKRSFDKDSFIAFAKESGANDNVIKLVSHYVNISAVIERAKAL